MHHERVGTTGPSGGGAPSRDPVSATMSGFRGPKTCSTLLLVPWKIYLNWHQPACVVHHDVGLFQL
jgi:hypothetical protein